jgi:hypothetical protein
VSLLRNPCLVRVRDRFTLGTARDQPGAWEINPRTGFLQARAGLSWTGVREYRTPTGLLRVLRRPEQVCAPAHLRTLRLLPATEGHPAGDVDVSPANEAALRVGSTGDAIDIEDLKGYSRPVGNVSVSRPSTMVKMVDLATWQKLGQDFAALRDVVHDGSAPATGTSLGYNALWFGPYIEAEIVGERDDGSGVIGEWMGPTGPEPYDIEHIVDPECELIKQLEVEINFDASKLGGNHFAVALPALGGRGGEQSELMRIVDSFDLPPISSDLARQVRRVAIQVPARHRDVATWTVGTDRELPIVSGDWDGDAAAASVFEWAGFNADPAKPDPAKAKRAFLIYDADAPGLKGSYKLPIARYKDGRLEVVDAGLRAAASYLPQTDAPEDVRKRARDVLDAYYKKLEATRDATGNNSTRPQRNPMKTQQIEIGLGRDSYNHCVKSGLLGKLAARGKTLPQSLIVVLPVTDEIDPKALVGKLEEMRSMCSDLIEMTGEAMGEAAGMKEQMADMMSKEDAAALVAEKEAELAKAKEALAEAEATSDKLKGTCDALLAEVGPLRAKQLDELRDAAVKLGCDETKIKAAKDAAEVRRLVVAEKLGDASYTARDEAAKPAMANEPKPYRVSDDVVSGVYAGLVHGLLLAQPETPAPARDYNAPFSQFPTIVPNKPKVKPTQDEDQPVDSLRAGLAAMGG